MTRYFTVATAGHVDHGKTSLLKALTGINPDRLKEEREREMTTDLGFAPLILSKEEAHSNDETIIGFIDVPGHGKFLKNMLAGVGGITMALLVVAADEGVMPQTLQHVKILSLLGVRRVLVAINKIDLAPDMVQAVIDSVSQLLALYDIELVDAVPVAAPSGVGIEALRAALAECSGGDSLDNSIASTDDQGTCPLSTLPAYLPVDRVFSKSGFGKVVTGTLVEGTLQVGDTVYIEPDAVSARVRGLETFGRKLTAAGPGQRLAVNLSFKQECELYRGQVLSTAQSEPASTLLVTLRDLQGLEYFNDFERSQKGADSHKLSPQKIKIYHGTNECTGYLRWMEVVDAKDSTVIGQIALDKPLSARCQDRFVLRYGDHGIAGGVILTTARPRFLTRKLIIPFCQALAARDYVAALTTTLGASPRLALKASQLAWLIPGPEIDTALKQALKQRVVYQSADYYFEVASRKRLIAALQKYLSEQFRAKPDQPVSMETLRQKVCPQMERTLLGDLLGEITELRRDGNNIFAQGSHVPDSMDSRAQSIMEILKSEPVLEIAELSKRAGLTPDDFKKAFEGLKKANLASVVDREFAASRETIERGHRLMMQIYKEKKDISPSDLREAMQINRKYTMALLAYYDDHQITRRVATGRTLLKGI